VCRVAVTFSDLTSYQAGLLIRLHDVLREFPAPGRGREGAQDEVDTVQMQQLKQEIEVATAEYLEHHFVGGGNDPPDIPDTG